MRIFKNEGSENSLPTPHNPTYTQRFHYTYVNHFENACGVNQVCDFTSLVTIVFIFLSAQMTVFQQSPQRYFLPAQLDMKEMSIIEFCRLVLQKFEMTYKVQISWLKPISECAHDTFVEEIR